MIKSNIKIALMAIILYFCQGGAMAQVISYDWELQKVKISDDKTIVVLNRIAKGSFLGPEGQPLLTGLSLGCSPSYSYIDLHFEEKLKEPYSLTLVGGDGELGANDLFSLSPENRSLKGKAPEELLGVLLKHDKLRVKYETESGISDNVEFVLDFKGEYFEAFEEDCGWKR
jgi:hypothetical protein